MVGYCSLVSYFALYDRTRLKCLPPFYHQRTHLPTHHTHTHPPNQTDDKVNPAQQAPPAYCRTLCAMPIKSYQIFSASLARPKNGTRLNENHQLYNVFEDGPQKKIPQRSNIVKTYMQTKGLEIANQGTTIGIMCGAFVSVLCTHTLICLWLQ